MLTIKKRNKHKFTLRIYLSLDKLLLFFLCNCDFFRFSDKIRSLCTGYSQILYKCL